MAYSIRFIENLIKELDNKRRDFEDFTQDISNKANDIDLDEVIKLPYKEIKDLNLLLNTKVCLNTNFRLQLKELEESKKLEEYPELLDAHYFPELRQLEFLKQDERKLLDYNLKRYYKYYKIRSFYIFEDLNLNKEIRIKIINFLLENKIIERLYMFECGCYSDECSPKLVTQEERDRFYNWHNFDYDNATDDEVGVHEDNYKDGYIYIECCNDEEKEITTIEEFKKELKCIVYRIIKKPDYSLDNI